ncbi:response regulator [Candidatus Woesearchaeota archaeon]|nr:response regulator [Candidatus Woesearchaeota archaeon]
MVSLPLVLVVEDSDGFIKTIQRTLEPAFRRYEWRYATTVASAQTILDERLSDVNAVFLDGKLGSEYTWQLARDIRAKYRFNGTMIYIGGSEIPKGLESLFTECKPKADPLNDSFVKAMKYQQELLEVVQKYLK